ncbi:MAG: DUF192 domain-containing protein [Deltaproteobacteria bacterium]|nr:DUF192 domain-containing protein [Deltaproteobacteria bacterium]
MKNSQSRRVPIFALQLALAGFMALAAVSLLEVPLQVSRVAAAPGMAQAEVVISGKTLHLEIADTPELQARGLGGRKSLAPDQGMLFVYAERSRQRFWMLDMRFAIDIIWLDNGRVVHIEHQVPPPAPGTTPADLPTYEPAADANLVLELAAGRAKSLGLKIGQRLDFRFNVN